MSKFTDLNLNEKILSALEKKGYTTPTPIQQRAIPHVIEGKDLLGIAQTGTGKTAAFSLPILNNLAKNSIAVKSGCMRVLILTPTRELASQIADNIELYGKELGLRHAVMFGGVNERPQIATMQRGVDILIATPGRLLDLTNQGYIRYMQLEVFVLDEADRMLDMGFINDIKKIIQKIPPQRQTLFFSATMPATITDLANSILKNPIRVEVTPPSTTVERIDQKVFLVERGNKPALLKAVLKHDEVKNALVFCKMKHTANKVVEHLERHGIKVAAIHGNKSQSAREKALADFRSGAIQVLVATDIAARGIDIPGITHVINYEIPMDPESYVHRIGRTARAGKDGVAISFCDRSEEKLLQAVEKTIKYQIPVDDTHPFHGVAAAAPTHQERRESSRARSSNNGREKYSSNSKRGDDRRGNSRHREGFERKDEKRREPGQQTSGNRISNSTKGEGRSEKGFNFFGLGKLFGKKSDSRGKKENDGGERREGRNYAKKRPFGNRRPSSGGRSGGGFRNNSPRF